MRSRLARRWTSPHIRQGTALLVVAMLIAVPMAVYIQERWNLYSSSMTMSLVEMAFAAIGVMVIGLFSIKRYGWAWAVLLVIPPILFVLAMRWLEAHPPTPPLG
jgi:hypothetical protein